MEIMDQPLHNVQQVDLPLLFLSKLLCNLLPFAAIQPPCYYCWPACCFAKRIDRVGGPLHQVQSQRVRKKLTSSLALQGVHCGQGTSVLVVFLLTIFISSISVFFQLGGLLLTNSSYSPIFLFFHIKAQFDPLVSPRCDLDQDHLLPSRGAVITTWHTSRQTNKSPTWPHTPQSPY